MRECGGSRRTVVDAGAEPLLALGLLALLAEAEEAELLLNSGMGIISLAAVADVVPVPLRLEEEDAEVAPPPRPRRCSEEEDEDDGVPWLFAAAAVWRVSTSTMTRSCEILCSSIFKYSRLFSGPPFSLSSYCPAGETSAAALTICSL